MNACLFGVEWLECEMLEIEEKEGRLIKCESFGEEVP